MSLTAAAIRNDRVTLVVLVVLVLAGVRALQTLPRAEDPGFTIRVAVVTTYLPGASPQRVEALVTDTVEEKVQEIPELDHVESMSRTGVSVVFVVIRESEDDMRPIWDDLRRKMEALAPDLPSEAIGPVVDDEFGDVFPVVLTVSGDDFDFAELQTTAESVRDDLLHLDQVAQVEIYGDQEERIFVEYNTARLAEVGLSPGQLSSILSAQNIIVSGGSVTVFGEDITLEPTGNYESLEDVRRTIIPLPGGRGVQYLGDLARIERGTADPPTARVHSTGRRCLGLSIAPPEGTGNVSELGAQVEALLPHLRADHPVGLEFDLVIFQPDFIDEQVDGFVVNLAQAMGIVLLVMLVSLGLRTGLLVSTLIPTAMLATLVIMQLFGVGLDQISIAALIIALGMLVDNAIVMSESIQVSMGEGENPFDAAVESARELRVPLLVASSTTSAAFLPIFLADAAIGEYTGSLFVVVSIALLSSWGLALTMMPLLCVLFLRVPVNEGDSTYDTRFYRSYRSGLLAAVRRPWLSLAVTVAVFALAMVGLGFVPNVFMPKSDSERLVADLSYPLGTSIAKTESMLLELEEYVLENHMARNDREGFVNWSAYVGNEGAPRYRLAFEPAIEGSEHVQMVMTATSRAFIDTTIAKLRDFVDTRFPAVKHSWNAEAMGPAAKSPVAVRLSGTEIEPLFRLVERVQARLRAMPGVIDVDDDWGPRTKKLRVVIDQARARRAGASSQDVAVSLQTGLSGIEVTEFRESDDIVPIVLRSVAADRQDLGKIENMDVFVQSTGASIPLSQIARIEVDWEPSKILRRDRTRTVTVTADLQPGVGALDVASDLSAWLASDTRTWPRGYSWELGGDEEESAEANASLVEKMPIAGFVILFLLVTQFNSFRRVMIVLLTIPLGLIGVTIGLLVTGEDFTFMALLGVISLAGILINNAIVLLDRIRIEIEDNGRSPADAVIESAQRRLRPILVTTATTVGGLLPLWFFGGPMWAPMAVSILFGLLFATTLTLGVVPLLYSLLFRVRYGG